jgi:ABC-type bacteriocin/lantibiotic exporter with double-glycine peptidase domain
MIKLKLFKQSKSYCGPASLKMVLSAYGKDYSENYLAKLTKASRREGTSEEDIVKAAKKLGFKAYTKEKSSIKELKKLVLKNKMPIIVTWFSPEAGNHFSVVVGFNKENILLANPHYGKIIKYKITWFEKRWFDTSENKLTLREITVIKNDN